MSSIPKDLSVEDTCATFRPVGEFTFDQMVDLIDEALAYCTANEIHGLFVDALQVTGFPSPTTTQRFKFATQWSTTAAGQVVLAMAVRPELIDPERIGVTMLSNRGLISEVFTSESEALQWLVPLCK